MNSAIRMLFFYSQFLTGNLPPVGSSFMITESPDEEDMITEDGVLMATEG